LAIDNLSVAFAGARVVDDIDFRIRHGEAVGVVGESGSGKTVTWLAALGLLPRQARVEGRVRLDGDDILGVHPAVLDRVRGGRVAMIFQDPASALNPVLTIGRQIGEVLAVHRGLSGAAVRAEAKRLLDLVGIPDPDRRLAAYPHEFSGGQNQRIMIAMALAGAPDLLIADEPTTALDATIQAQILDLVMAVRRETGMALVLISHDLGVVSQVCDRVVVMYAGRIVEEGPAAALFDEPCHPYSRGLIGAQPAIDGPRRRLVTIAGTVPAAGEMPPGCAFAPRCRQAGEACGFGVPALVTASAGHRAACIHPIRHLEPAGRSPQA
jgi:peptide/nickel transport system ATP-binding protein